MNTSKPIFIEMSIGDQLTSISCGHVVVELIKFIAYQRQQIPYVYPWLKQIINTRKETYDKNVQIKESFQSENHFRVASTALENLDFILKSLLQEMNGSVVPEEVCIALGSSSFSCKEMYRLMMPTVCHKPQCHSANIASDQKIQRTVFKTLVTSEKLSQVFFNPLSPANLYVFIKKRTQTQGTVVNTDSFLRASGFRVPSNTKIIVIDLRSVNRDGLKCCNDFQIFGEAENKDVETVTTHTNEDEFYEIEPTDTFTWYQSSYVMKGFKDCVVNGSSITNTWVSS